MKAPEMLNSTEILTGPLPDSPKKFDGRFGALSAPLVMAGDRLLGVASGNIFGIDIHTCELAVTGDKADPEWVVELKSRVSSEPHVATFGGVVYFMDGRDLLAVGLADAKRLDGWKVPEKLGRVSRLIARADRVLAVHAEGKGTAVSGFAGRTGARLFGPMPVATHSAGSVTFGDRALFFVASGKLNAVNVDYGEVRWRFDGAGDALDATTEPLVAAEVVLVAGKSLHAVTLERGEKRFTIPASETTPAGVHWHTPVADIPQASVAATNAVNLRATRPLLGDSLGAQTMLAASARARGGAAIATNTAGDVICFSLADGKIAWREKVKSPGAPVLIDGVVYVATDGGTKLARFDAGSGKRTGVAYDLPLLTRDLPLVIGNGALFLPHEDGSVSAHPFAIEQAAYFNGVSSMIKVPAEATTDPARGRFDFGTGDFTVEAWFRSTIGGEIVSSYPTAGTPASHGFRLNLSPAGQVRGAVVNSDATSVVAGRTNATVATDGEWHHVAFVRRAGAFMIVLDGLSYDVRVPDEQKDTPLSMDGKAALTIGAFIPAPTVKDPTPKPDEFFRGLIREVRLWDRALDLRTIATNRAVALTGLEPRLQGLWRLAEPQQEAPAAPRNEASRHRTPATFVNADSRRTDLTMDQLNFPYLLHESTAQWPYAGTWAARGEQQVNGSPTLSTNGVVAFSTRNCIYAVRAQDGTRAWAMNINPNTSEAAADCESFLVLTEEESLVRIDARSGGKVQVEAFDDVERGSGVRPAVCAEWIAVAAAGNAGKIYLWDRKTPKSKPVAVGGVPESLAFGDAGLGVLTRSGAQLTLHLVDASAGSVRSSRAVKSTAFCMAGQSLFAVTDAGIVKFDGKNLSASASTVTGDITGLTASVAHNILIATTAAGEVHALTLATLAAAWKTTLPLGPAGRGNRVNPPAIDPAGRVICTTSSGAIVALSAETGALQGFYGARHGTVETPAFHAGTVYTGCLPSFANDVGDEVDGALHSIVFGETMAMRLNLDRSGRPVANAAQHAVVEPDPETSTLHLLRLRDSCIEAWVNAPALKGSAAAKTGGGILGIAPSTNSPFGVNLWLEADGTVHYTSYSKEGGAWKSVHMTAPAAIVDGKWHHIALSRRPTVASINLYIDGQLTQAETTTGAGAPPTLGDGDLKAYIGAFAADDLSAARPFHGMIAEVRIWDTWNPVSEIASRMHVKLRGDEPGLVAYWNFDYESVYDGARQGHDGQLAEPEDVPAWWLTDLPFTQPAYPHITNSAVIASEEEGKAKSYRLAVKVCAADGKGLSGQAVNLWYVRKHEDEPGVVTMNGTEIEAVDSGHERRRLLRAAHIAKSFMGTTGADGTLKVTIATAVAGHGPAIDMWTSFMPEHQRFHVNVLIDNQTLEKPAPPTLTAQSKLIQDYHYTTGNTINDGRDRSTWRVVLKAANPNGDPRGNEPVTIWASESTTIEVRNNAFAVNQDNSVTLDCTLGGELTVVLGADDLTAPTLYARAGFMHRNDRVVINPDQDAHSRLSTLKGSQLTEKRSTNWKKPEDRKPEDEDSLLSKEAAPHAGKVADAVRTVTSSVKTADPNDTQRLRGLSPARRQLLLIRPMPETERKRLLMADANAPWSPPLLLAMRQPEVATPTDRVVARRTLAGVSRPAPVDTEAFRDSLGKNLGFVFEANASGKVIYRTLETQEEVDAERGKASPKLVKVHVAGFFGDLWDGIKDVANTIYDGATKIVMTIADTIELAITTMVKGIESVVHAVVETVTDALNAVANFFEQLAVGIMKVIAFLRALFDWGNILKTHDILFDIFDASMKISATNLRSNRPIIDALRSIGGVPVKTVEGGESLNNSSNIPGGKASDAISSAKSVESKSVVDRASESPVRVTAPSGVPDPSADPSDPFQKFVQGLPALATSFLDLSPGDLLQKLLDLLRQAAVSSVVAAAETMGEIMDKLAEPIEWVAKMLSTTIEIPFISELYKWITGRDLSLLSVFCLGVAVQVNVVYAVVTLIAGNPGFFFEDAKSIAETMKAAAKRLQGGGALAEAPGAAPAGEPPPTPRAPEIALMVFRTLAISSDGHADWQFAQTTGRGNANLLDQGFMAFINVLQGVMGAISLSLQTFCCQPAFEKRVRAVVTDAQDDFLSRYVELTYATYGVLVALRANKLRAGVTYFLTGPSQGGGILSRVKDKVEFPIALAASVAAAVLVGYGIYQLNERMQKLQDYGNSDVATAYKLLGIRDILGLSGAMFEFMFTADGAQWMQKKFGSVGFLYEAAALLRWGSNHAGTVLHGVAVFNYGGM
jgi:outer membrane protein assembly factor BamB